MVNEIFFIDLTQDFIDDGADVERNYDKYRSCYRNYIDGVAADAN